MPYSLTRTSATLSRGRSGVLRLRNLISGGHHNPRGANHCQAPTRTHDPHCVGPAPSSDSVPNSPEELGRFGMERPEHVLILREAVTTLARLGRLNARRRGIVSAPCHASQPMASRRSAARIEVKQWSNTSREMTGKRPFHELFNSVRSRLPRRRNRFGCLGPPHRSVRWARGHRDRSTRSPGSVVGRPDWSTTPPHR